MWDRRGHTGLLTVQKKVFLHLVSKGQTAHPPCRILPEALLDGVTPSFLPSPSFLLSGPLKLVSQSRDSQEGQIAK